LAVAVAALDVVGPAAVCIAALVWLAAGGIVIGDDVVVIIVALVSRWGMCLTAGGSIVGRLAILANRYPLAMGALKAAAQFCGQRIGLQLNNPIGLHFGPAVHRSVVLLLSLQGLSNKLTRCSLCRPPHQYCSCSCYCYYNFPVTGP